MVQLNNVISVVMKATLTMYLRSAVFVWTLTVWSAYIVEAVTTNIRATAPVDPVQTAGILSLHCQVWNLREGQEVAIYRDVEGQVERLSMGGTVADLDNERTFLAVRQMDDSSIVYFLSITNAMRQDAGTYSCRVISAVGSVSEVTADKVKINVAYFPSDAYPICTPKEPLEVREGSVVTLRCTSELTSPPVDIHWSRTGSGAALKADSTLENGEIYSELSLKVNLIDNGAIFLCEINSPLFPGLTKTCHVGPIKVMSKTPSTNNRYPGTNNEIGETEAPLIVVDDRVTREKNNNTAQCRDVCASLSSNEFNWIVATVASVFVAIIFLLIALTLLVRYCNMVNRANMDTHRRLQRAPQEYIYTEVEGRKELEKIYMSLERQNSRKYPLN